MKTVLITGGTRGIGLACLKKFIQQGWNCAFFYKSSDEIAKDIEKELGAFPVKCDVSSSVDVKSATAKVVEKFGKIDALVNNAGISYTGLLQDMCDEEWQNIINVNLTAAFYLTREIIPIMLSMKSGAIVNISSMWGVSGASCEVAYSTSKAGLIGFTKSLAKELAPSGIRVNAIAPGAVKTDMLKEYTNDDLEAIAQDTPLGVLGTPEDIAEAVFFLADDKAKFITGEVLNVNGGFII